MYSVQITQTRPSIDVPFYWEINSEIDQTYLATLRGIYGTLVNLGDRIYSEDRLVVTMLMTAENMDDFNNARLLANADASLNEYWLTRDEYNFNNNISKILNEV